MARRGVLITGGSRGIGEATALRFGAQGESVCIAARNPGSLNETVHRLKDTGHDVFGIPADVADPQQAESMVRQAARLMGRLDVLVNNAGVAALKPLPEVTADDWAACVGINLSAVVYTTRAVWSIMKEQGGGVIINISSVAAKDPFPGFAHYGAAKAAVNLFSQAAAREGQGDNIRVYALGPGAVDTPMLRGAFPDFPKEDALEPKDVAEVAVQLAASGARYLSGQIVYVTRKVP